MCTSNTKRPNPEITKPPTSPNTSTYYHHYITELQSQFQISIPTIIALFVSKIPWLISLHFAGLLGAQSLAAAALATTFCNVTGMSASVGLSYAISTLTCQSVGHLTSSGGGGDLDESVCLEQGGKDGIYVDEFEGHSGGTNDTGDGTLVVDRDTIREKSVNLPSPSSVLPHDNQHDTTHPNNQNNTILNGNISLSTEQVEEENRLKETTHLLRTLHPTIYDTIMDDHLYLMTGDTRNQRHAAAAPLQPLVYLYRGIVIQMAIILPVGVYWLYGVGPMLLALGQGEELAKTTENYLRILTPGLWAFSINWTVSSWLQCINILEVPAYSALIGCALHIPFNNLFVHKLGFGLSGVAMATVTFQCIQPLCTCMYVFRTSHGIQRVLDGTGATAIGRTTLGTHGELLHAATSSLSDILQYLALALPGMVAISEWWASEISILLAGRLHPNPAYTLAGMAIYQSLNTFCFMLPAGTGIATSTRVGLALGRNDSRGARLATHVGIVTAVCCTLVLGCVLLFTPHEYFPSFFTGEKGVIEVTAATLPFLAFYLFADGVQVTLSGVVKGCGRQAILMPIVIFAYWMVGLPLGYYLAFVRNGGEAECSYENYDGEWNPSSLFGCGVVGLVVGLTTGTWVHFVFLALAVYFTVDWDIEVVRAQERLALEKKK